MSPKSSDPSPSGPEKIPVSSDTGAQIPLSDSPKAGSPVTGSAPQPAPSKDATAFDSTTSAPSKAPTKAKKHAKAELPHTRAGAWWMSLIIGALLLIALLVFILQNLETQTIFVLFWEWEMPLGVALLGAAILGVLLTATIGGVRIMQLRRQARKGLR